MSTRMQEALQEHKVMARQVLAANVLIALSAQIVSCLTSTRLPTKPTRPAEFHIFIRFEEISRLNVQSVKGGLIYDFCIG